MSAPLGSNNVITSREDPLEGLPFRAVRRLGGGMTGDVYLAEHRQLGKVCVVKVLPPRLAGDEVLTERFKLAARTLGCLRSPHIVSVSGAGITPDGRPYIVMEFLEGRTVAEELEARGPLPVVEALGYTCQLLLGLGAAHAAGIVHRDVRPANLFLCEGLDGVRTLKVVDFGLTRIVPEAPEGAPEPLPVPTATKTFLGAPAYASPEGAQGLPVDCRADLYATALVLYSMVAGRGPFDHFRSAAMILSAHVAEAPNPPSHFTKATIPHELDIVLLRALSKGPSERYQTADAFREALDWILKSPEPPSLWKDTDTLDVSSFSAPVRSAADSSRGAESQSGAQLTQSARRASARSPDVVPRSAPLPVSAVHRQREISVREALTIFLATAVLAAVAAAALVGGGR